MMVLVFKGNNEIRFCTKNKCWGGTGSSRKGKIGSSIDKVNMAEGQEN